MTDAMENCDLEATAAQERDDAVSGDLERRFRRGRRPGIGSFVTIAAAVLILFGTASRMGKNPEVDSLFGLDRQSEERIKREEERLKGMLILGGVPSDRAVPAASGAVNIDPDAPPPVRGDFPLPVAGEEGSESGRLSRVPLAMSGGFWRDAWDAAGPDLAD